MSFLEKSRKDLNAAQFDAVSTTKGPVLVLAGAGTGKTRVLTYRIAHLVMDEKVPTAGILAMTFSNKAAREMHERVRILLNYPEGWRLPWISTFHSVAARLLRTYGERLGYKPDYVIYDESEQKTLMRDCLEAAGISEKEWSVDTVRNRIGEWKNDGITAERSRDFSGSKFDEICSQAYRAYQASLLKAQAMDFDDLLMNFHRLFADFPEIKQKFHAQWQYILVDEFQDTNKIQYKILQEVLNDQKNICVVGDDDQSIYGWRGAKLENILNFDKEMPNCAVVRLEENYRSTGNILKAAMAVISKNDLRHSKTLWTKAGEGQRIRFESLEDDRREAEYILDSIQKYIRDGIPAEEIAVLYRVNSLSRGFEEECLRRRVPYRIVGGFRFYERKEIKDVLSYLRFLMNPSDVLSFRRSIGTPSRGVGKVSLEKVEAWADAQGRPLGEVLISVPDLPVSGKARQGLEEYRDLLKSGYELLEKGDSLVDLFVEVLKRARMVESLEEEGGDEGRERVENIRELLSAVQEFEENWNEADSTSTSGSLVRRKLRDFLERVSLMSDLDLMEDEPGQVTFMSLHAAKGLEFKVCFIAAMEEGVFPSFRSLDDYGRLEEERRLCYVGMTRARERLFLTRAERRRTFGSYSANVASRFLKDLPEDILESFVEPPRRSVSQSWGYDSYSFKRKSAAVPKNDDFDFDFDQRTDREDLSYKKGDAVVHPSFGEGVVQRSELLGSDECLSIAFVGRGTKKFSLNLFPDDEPR